MDFRSRGFWSRDGLLESWLRLMCLQLDDADSPGWQRDLREWWMLQSNGCFGGCVSPALDEHLTEDERVQVILSVCDRTVERLREFGPYVPAAFLNMLNHEGGFTRDLPLDYFEQMAAHFRGLLLGALTEEAARTVLPVVSGRS